MGLVDLRINIWMSSSNTSMVLNVLGCHLTYIVQELCESRGGRPRLSVLTSLMVSVDVKQY